MKPFVLIVGPTGSGKSALALHLAHVFKGGVVNSDSLQTYKRLDIGTAKPSPSERALVPHWLFDFVEPGQVLTAGDYRKLAIEVLTRELPERPVFGVGGSGFYIQALEKGMFEISKPDPKIEAGVRQELAEHGLAHMHRELLRLDPAYGEEINPNDSYRIIRGITIIRDSGRLVSELKNEFQAKEFPFPLLKLGLLPTREELLPRVERRTQSMLESGLVQEVQGLIQDGFRAWAPLQSVGYKESLAFIEGQLPQGRLLPQIIEKTMQLAKKQRTWFKRDSQIHWLPMLSPEVKAQDLVLRFLDSLR